MSITFGSVGDIIAVGQIAWSLAQALTDSKGSAKEYQGLIKELRAFERAVLQIVALWQNYNSPDVITTDVTKDWLDTLRAFQEKVDRKYGRYLAGSGSGSWVRDASKKVLWLKEKEDILDLRRKLSLASETITMLTLAAMGKSNKLAEGEIKFRVRVVHRMLEDAKKRAEEQAAQLKAIDEKVEAQSKTSDLILSNVKSGIVSLTQVYSMTIDIKNILCLLQSYIILQQSTPRGIGTGWQYDPVTLEDALGFRHLIPLDVVTSWKILDVILLERFKKRPGYQKVLKGEFAIEEGITGRDISRENEFAMCFRPGQKIDMSMIFSDLDINSNYCPRCRTKSEASAEARTQCTSCQMWFQRLVEIDDESDPEPVPEPAERPTIVYNSVRTKKAKVVVSTPADFQRVRLMSISRPKEQKAKEEPRKRPVLYGSPPGYEAQFLEREFKKNPKPTLQMKRQFAEDVGIELTRIINWFKNRRAKQKQEKKRKEWEADLGREWTEGERRLEDMSMASWEDHFNGKIAEPTQTIFDLPPPPPPPILKELQHLATPPPLPPYPPPPPILKELQHLAIPPPPPPYPPPPSPPQRRPAKIQFNMPHRTSNPSPEAALARLIANKQAQGVLQGAPTLDPHLDTQGFIRSRSERNADLAEQEQLEDDHGGPLTASAASSPMKKLYDSAFPSS